MSSSLTRMALATGIALTSLASPALAGGDGEDSKGIYVTLGAGTLGLDPANYDFTSSSTKYIGKFDPRKEYH